MEHEFGGPPYDGAAAEVLLLGQKEHLFFQLFELIQLIQLGEYLGVSLIKKGGSLL